MGKAVEARFGKRALPPRPGIRSSRAARHGDQRPRRAAIRELVDGRTAATSRLAGLDLLRLLAALMIVLFHFGYAGSTRGMMDVAYPEVSWIAKYAFVGVDLFFVISGFVIAVSAQGRDWRQFAASRMIRLYPAHVACMTFTALVLLAMTGPGAAPTAWQWLANMTMFAPAFGQPFIDGAYWSIVLEIIFYGWVALMLALGLYERRLLTIIAVWLAIAFVNEALFQWRPLRILLVTEYAGMFASGMLIHRIRAGDRSLIAFALLGFAVALGALHAFESQRAFDRLYADSLDIGVLWTLHAAIYGLFFAALWLSRRLPAATWVLALGGLTYPLYLMHQSAGYLWIEAAAPLIGRWAALGLATAAALVVAFLVYRFAEPLGRHAMQRALRPFAPAR
jgi:peptidoglycan/LPS O-acetylase OafA/YrhL